MGRRIDGPSGLGIIAEVQLQQLLGVLRRLVGEAVGVADGIGGLDGRHEGVSRGQVSRDVPQVGEWIRWRDAHQAGFSRLFTKLQGLQAAYRRMGRPDGGGHRAVAHDRSILDCPARLDITHDGIVGRTTFPSGEVLGQSDGVRDGQSAPFSLRMTFGEQSQMFHSARSVRRRRR